MMTTDIVNEIAHLVAQRAVGLGDSKDSRPVKAPKNLPAPQDQVTLTSLARSYASDGGPESEMGKEQAMKVERLKALVAGGNYKMDPQTVESIAERIAKTLL